MTRLRAAALHLSLSALVGTILFSLFWFLWYPAPIFKALGGIDIFLMLLGIDVAVGPLLTLIVFRTGKKTLKLDLTVIVCMQFLALGYGVYTLFIGRPVYVVALGHRFDVVTASEVEPADLAKANAHLPWFGPKWVGIRPATDSKERERVLFSGEDYGHFPQYHAPLLEMRDEILRTAKPVASLVQLNPGREAQIRAWLSAHGSDEASAVFQGLKARSEDMAVVIDRTTGHVVGIAPFKPWE